jgi:5,10-methenyltetrahydromethanopterin hydrogenase
MTMKPSEAAELLSLAAAWDDRKVTSEKAKAWAESLAGLDPQDCAEAIRAHFADSTEYLMPAHIKAGVKKIRNDRIKAANSALLEPHDVDPDDVVRYLAAGRARRRMIAAGQDVDTPPEIEGAKRPVEQLMRVTAARLPRLPRVDVAKEGSA